MPGILYSVGSGGVNRKQDVVAIQSALNAVMGNWIGILPFQLQLNGIADAALLTRIKMLQARYAPSQSANGLLGPNDALLVVLDRLGSGAFVPVPAPRPDRVTYSPDLPANVRLVDPYSIAVIEKALEGAKMTAAVITSTLRLPPRQAAIMYSNAVKDLAAQYRLYGANGDAILDIYKANKAKPKDVVVALMAQKMTEMVNKGRSPSNHVTTVEGYKRMNIIDIGVNSTKTASGTSFDETGLTAAFKALKTSGHIHELIDETKKSNMCWHLEIKPNARSL